MAITLEALEVGATAWAGVAWQVLSANRSPAGRPGPVPLTLVPGPQSSPEAGRLLGRGKFVVPADRPDLVTGPGCVARDVSQPVVHRRGGRSSPAACASFRTKSRLRSVMRPDDRTFRDLGLLTWLTARLEKTMANVAAMTLGPVTEDEYLRMLVTVQVGPAA